MSPVRFVPFVLLLLVSAGLCLLPETAHGCAACFGQSDSRLAAGMNWGIFTLLGVVGCVLGSFAAFLIYLVRKAASAPPTDAAEPPA